MTQRHPPMRLQRLPDWPARLAACLAAARQQPFVWGQHDCVCFAARCVQAMTGCNPLQDLPAWASPLEARAVLRAEGGLQAAVTKRLRLPVPAVLAMRGDVVLLPRRLGGGRTALGVCLGGQVVAAAVHGLAVHSVGEALLAWPIAHADGRADRSAVEKDMEAACHP